MTNYTVDYSYNIREHARTALDITESDDVKELEENLQTAIEDYVDNIFEEADQVTDITVDSYIKGEVNVDD